MSILVCIDVWILFDIELKVVNVCLVVRGVNVVIIFVLFDFGVVVLEKILLKVVVILFWLFDCVIDVNEEVCVILRKMLFVLYFKVGVRKVKLWLIVLLLNVFVILFVVFRMV